jgi:hypothetical protein
MMQIPLRARLFIWLTGATQSPIAPKTARLYPTDAFPIRADHEPPIATRKGNLPPLISVRTYHFDPGVVRTTVHLADHYAQRVARGEAVASILLGLRREGFNPHLVPGYGGWGETLFVRDVWPDCSGLSHADFF